MGVLLLLVGSVAWWLEPRVRIAVAWGVAALLVAVPQSWFGGEALGRSRWRTAVQWLSAVSYSVFLIHFGVCLAVNAAGFAAVAHLGGLAASVGGAAITHRVAMVVLGGGLQGQCGIGLADEPIGLSPGRGLLPHFAGFDFFGDVGQSLFHLVDQDQAQIAR
jgi:hypothetical protein